MQSLIRENPDLKAGFAYSLETLALELTARADAWGESRSDESPLGTAGILSALVRLDPAEQVVRVVGAQMGRRYRRG